MFTIETERFRLRDFNDHDLAHYTAQCQDPKYQRFYNDEDCSAKKCRQLVELFITQANQVPRLQYHLAIEERQSGKYIGIAGLRLEDERQASVGCGLVRQHQSQGASEEAMRALLKFGFNQLNIHRAYAETISDNRAAIRLCQKIGMKAEGELIEHRFFKQKWWNTTILAIRRDDFL
ncbi:GNAT family N-acetyltransferase [Vibrio sp. JPW-9-11-11]|uniref:GNAT family N-acetyltransferase n=1 Tax=Vibrio sp. JPW-9-11-11 TaxID=1416532 RepID=UPI00159437DB|nr:GNAT family protein [Vibrio sp. JPW-9-11-11]NVD07948.1 GNAT family N-acetyltransferase [Vibrio sp. JPW-9-11-11]